MKGFRRRRTAAAAPSVEINKEFTKGREITEEEDIKNPNQPPKKERFRRSYYIEPKTIIQTQEIITKEVETPEQTNEEKKEKIDNSKNYGYRRRYGKGNDNKKDETLKKNDDNEKEEIIVSAKIEKHIENKTDEDLPKKIDKNSNLSQEDKDSLNRRSTFVTDYIPGYSNERPEVKKNENKGYRFKYRAKKEPIKEEKIENETPEKNIEENKLVEEEHQEKEENEENKKETDNKINEI